MALRLAASSTLLADEECRCASSTPEFPLQCIFPIATSLSSSSPSSSSPSCPPPSSSASQSCHLKPYHQFKKEWCIGKQIGWGGQGSVFTVTPKLASSSSSSSSSPIEYVAKCMYFTDDEQFGTLQQRMSAVHAIRTEYAMVGRTRLLHYTDFYYDQLSYYKAVIVMERLGESLNSSYSCSHHRQRSNPIYSIKKIALDLAHNLQAIHSAHFAHLDVKKENIMWHPRSKQWKLIDFGMAREIPAQLGYVRCSQFIGTKSWTAPEIAVMERGADNVLTTKCDIYSYGLVLLNLSIGAHHYVALNGADYDELLFLRRMCTRDGHRQFMCYLQTLEKQGVLTRGLFGFLRRILEFDARKRPNIQQVLNLPYLN